MVKLICYNIEYCEGMDGHVLDYLAFWKMFFPPKNLDKKIVSALHKLKPDVLALVEVDIGSFRAKKDEAYYFKKRLGFTSLVEKIKYPSNGFLKLLHYFPLLGKQANALSSRYKLTGVKYHQLSKGTKRLVIEATIHCPKKVTLLLAHLALGGETRKKQMNDLVNIVKGIKNPVILMGDFNTFRGVDELRTLLRKTHLTDMVSLDGPSQGLTQPAWHPSRRLDYVLVSPEINVHEYKVLNFHFSDHLPLFVDFSVK